MKTNQVSRKGDEISGNRSRADREASTADALSEYKLAACAWPSQAAILETTSVVDKLEIALLLTSVESGAISFLGSVERSHPCPHSALPSFRNRYFQNPQERSTNSHEKKPVFRFANSIGRLT